MIHREKAVVKTEPVSQVKEEPNSATIVEQGPDDDDEEEQQQRDIKPSIGENSNVIVMQQQPAQQQPPPLPLQQSTEDFEIENDPEAGPSGLQRATPNDSNRNQKQPRRYPIDSSDDDDAESVDERIWRPPAAFRFARTQEDAHFITDQWIPYDQDDQATNNDSSNFSDLAVQSANKNKNPTEEVIDLSENDSNATVQNASTDEQQQQEPNCSHEVLTAPDLQLDWLSDSSSDNEIVCAIHDLKATKKPQSSNVSVENGGGDSDVDVPAIDLTASDDEEISFARDDSSNEPLANRWSRHMLRNNFPHPHYRSLMRASSYHDDNNRNDR